MADTIQFDLVSPEKKLASVAATMVELPGMLGDMAAMPNHAPVLTTLRPGVIKVHGDGGVTEYVVTGGFAEISGEAATVLAEAAMDRSDVTRENVEALLDEAKAGVENATDDMTATSMSQRVNDLGTLMSDLGL
jgi:F-type H+-transporting ATPase subunit epsilon